MPEPSACQADVVAGRIVVNAPFSALLVCGRIPGGNWDRTKRAWSYPATTGHAKLIKDRIPRLESTGAFAALLQNGHAPQPAAPAPQPKPAGPEAAIPEGLITRPWRHQIAAYKFCLDRIAKGFRGFLLAMGMGTGKSLVACMLILGLAARRVLIACPLRVVPVWISQFERHVGIPVVVAGLDEDAGSVAQKQQFAAEELRLAEARGVPFIAVINYDSAWREPFAAWAEKQNWDLVIADEAHRIKAPGGKASLFFKRMRTKARYRAGLTGTPMPHSHTDIYAPFRFLDIGIFGPSFNAFRQEYCVMGGYQKKQVVAPRNLDKLEEKMRMITFRVDKGVLDLPPETHVIYHCDLGPEALRVYRGVEDKFVAEVKDGLVTAANAMVKLLRLQQITGGWVKTDDEQYHRIDSSKQKLLADTLEDIGRDEPVVVFCRFHADLDAVHEACRALGYASLELSGRRDELKRWQDGEAQVLAVQISAGGVGVDLTRARYSIYYSLSFSLGEYDQSLSRVHRPGQTRPVEHIHLVARNTVDVKIMRALERRAEVVEAILAEIKT
jgi:SNF2 family DNA or RNA helicase